MNKLTLLVAAAAATIASPALAVETLDFETTAGGGATVANTTVGNDFAALGLTFTGATYFQCGGGCPSPANGIFISGTNTNGSFTVNFLNAISNFSAVNVNFSAFTASAFDSGNNLLGTSSASNFLQAVSFNFGGISSIQFSTTTQFGVDNFQFTQNAAVPEPATWAMMLIGFGAVGFAMRRRSSVATRQLRAA